VNGPTHILVIRTPEGCSFSLPLAGPVARFLAWAVDVACVAALFYALYRVFGVAGAVAPNLAAAVFMLLIFGVWLCYGIVLEWLWRGRTVGKKLLRLQVMDERCFRLSFSQICIRNLLRLVDMLPALYLVGGVCCVLSRKAQRLGDLAAGTVVVRMPRSAHPDLAPVLGHKFNSLRRHPHLAARLRQCATGQEANIALQALMRRQTLDAPARVRIFARIAEHFRAMVAFPPEAALGLSDEQYVRNVVEILFFAAGDRPDVRPAAGAKVLSGKV
jgi:uncharacterized RDD family membrane protein YckC